MGGVEEKREKHRRDRGLNANMKRGREREEEVK